MVRNTQDHVHSVNTNAINKRQVTLRATPMGLKSPVR